MEDLDDLNDLIHGRGKWCWTGQGITTYPNHDDNAKKLHAACEELERRGQIERFREDPDFVIWKPKNDT